MNKNLLFPIGIASALICILGLLLRIPYVSLFMLIFYTVLFEMSISWLANKSLTSHFTNSQIDARFKSFLIQTKWFQILMLFYLVVRINIGIESKLLFLYGNILIVFYTVGYLLSMSSIELKSK